MKISRLKKILFITTHNLASNPRLYKEAKLALKEGFRVEIICFEFNNWSKKINEYLKEELSAANIISISAGRRPFLPWLKSVVSESFFRMAGRFFTLTPAGLSKAVSRRTNLLSKALNKLISADLVIGHNPGAIWPTLQAAKKFKCPAGFDVEDYHPGEGNNRYLQMACLKLLQESLTQFNYVSFASPLILEKTRNNIVLNDNNIFTVLNLFPSSEFMEPKAIEHSYLKLIWFSQNISFERGLEKIVPVINKLFPAVHLHLYGNPDPQFFESILKNQKGVFVHGGVSQKELHLLLSEFDAGLAIEPGKDENNKLAISNKLLAYLQAGLYIISTDTKAQTQFIEQFPGHGISLDKNFKNADGVINSVINRLDVIRKNKTKRYKDVETINWENESQKLSGAWRELI